MCKVNGDTVDRFTCILLLPPLNLTGLDWIEKKHVRTGAAKQTDNICGRVKIPISDLLNILLD